MQVLHLHCINGTLHFRQLLQLSYYGNTVQEIQIKKKMNNQGEVKVVHIKVIHSQTTQATIQITIQTLMIITKKLPKMIHMKNQNQKESQGESQKQVRPRQNVSIAG